MKVSGGGGKGGENLGINSKVSLSWEMPTWIVTNKQKEIYLFYYKYEVSLDP